MKNTAGKSASECRYVTVARQEKIKEALPRMDLSLKISIFVLKKEIRLPRMDFP